jgi:Flp pilus assembly protein TadD
VDDASADEAPAPADDASADDASADGRESAYELLRRGEALMRQRHHAQAAIVLSRAARVEPGRGSILEALGRAYYNSNQPEPAAATFEELLAVDPSAHYAHFALGQALKRLGRRSEARTHLKLAVALAPGSNLYRSALRRLGPPDESPVPAHDGDGEANEQPSEPPSSEPPPE